MFTAASSCRSVIACLTLTLLLANGIAAEPPVKVFILAGQSNMEGHGFIAADSKRNGGKGSLEQAARDPGAAASLRQLLADDGQWVERDDVWISYFDRRGPLKPGYGAQQDRIGPELGFGWVMGEAFEEPVLLIKTAWGGRSLAVDFRPPSAGSAQDVAPNVDAATVGKAYRDMLAEIRRVLDGLPALFPELAGRHTELAGFGWHQGWNDRINQAFNDEYASNMAHFIRDVRRELDAPKLPFVIAETGMNGPDETHPRALSLMKRQAEVAAMTEFQGNVSFVPTQHFWRTKEESPTGQGYHWNSNAETYHLIGNAMGQAMLALLDVRPETAEQPAATRLRLQIINGSAQTADVFWLKSDTERVPNGSVAPGEDTVITTTAGHSFVVVGREDKAESFVTSEVLVQGFRFDPGAKDGVPAFYTQRVNAHGFPIVASARVNPYALKEAAYLVDLMLANRPDVRAAMIKSGARLCILAHDEFTTDQPEFVRLGAGIMPGYEGVSAKDYWDARARGLGGSERDPYCSCGEENLLGYPGDPYAKENILIHELAHNIHLRGLLNVDPTFDQRLKAAYEAAKQAGLWKGKYASVNHHEYFAEGVQSWFDDNRENDHDHNHVNTRAELIEYDPALAAICREVFGDTELKYSKPATRLTGHMAGYDPAAAPTFVWPERLMQAKAQIRAKAEARDQTANAESATGDQ